MQFYRAATFLICAVAIFCAGCIGPKFESLPPYASGDYGGNILGKPERGAWLWVRGRLAGDLDGARDAHDRLADEEALLVTLQKGDDKNPGPATEAWLCLVDINPVNKRKILRARTKIFDVTEPADTLPMPTHAVGVWTEGPIEGGRLDAADLDGDGTKEILVSLWRKTGPSRLAVSHRVFRMSGKKLAPVFGCRVIQAEASLRHEDHNKDGVDEIIVPSAALSVRGKPGLPRRPQWISIYTADKAGLYHQANESFSGVYDETQVRFFEDFALSGFDGADLTVHCFYLGLIYHYRAERDMAQVFLKQASGNTGSIGQMATELLGAAKAVPAPAPKPRTAPPIPAVPAKPDPAPENEKPRKGKAQVTVPAGPEM